MVVKGGSLFGDASSSFGTLVMFPAARTPIRACGQCSFAQDLVPFADRFVVGLEADQAPGQFHQSGAQAWVAVLGYATLQARVAATVFSGTESGVAADLAAIVEPMPIADLAID